MREQSRESIEGGEREENRERVEEGKERVGNHRDKKTTRVQRSVPAIYTACGKITTLKATVKKLTQIIFCKIRLSG